MRLRTSASPRALRHKFSTLANDDVCARGRTAIEQSLDRHLSPTGVSLPPATWIVKQKTACGHARVFEGTDRVVDVPAHRRHPATQAEVLRSCG